MKQEEMGFWTAICALVLLLVLTIYSSNVEKRVRKLEHKNTRVDEWHLQSYQYVLTLQDSFWVEVRRADGSIVGQVWCDTTNQLGKLFYHDNE